ncbi:hypothetical protein [Microbacterium lacticum]|uniref:hypothetical protein n=1 Tax=Microbacterium lacticum TaxID=33885 RepID=UPI003A83EBB9
MRPGVRRKCSIVQAIREQGIDLASSSDSGELRRVSAEYALEHLQLAYASTVHGIQGETADASIVGPDVDAAGLYVGLTRGRIHNVAIAVARTDVAALEAMALSMMRGTPELTMADAVSEAEAEWRHAAREREPHTSFATPATVRGVGIQSLACVRILMPSWSLALRPYGQPTSPGLSESQAQALAGA